jgi:ATP-dependent Clp protease adaptor protein ClpS
MGAMTTPKVEPAQVPTIDDVYEVDPVSGWVTIAWNDPVNLMSYVTWVLQKLFGYEHEKAERLMLDIHHKGRATVSHGPRERMEFDAARLHHYGLWATVDKS